MPQLNKQKAAAVRKADTTNPFEAIASGYYKAKLTKVESQKSKAGNPQWVWFFDVVGTKKKLREYTSLEEAALWKIATIFEAFGVDSETSTDTLLGQEILIEIGVEIAERGKLKGKKVNYIVGYPDQNLEPRAFEATEDEDGGEEEKKPAPKKPAARKPAAKTAKADESPDF